MWAAASFDGDDALTVWLLEVCFWEMGRGGRRYAGSALFLVRNSQSSRVKMSFVTAAMEKRVRRALHRASMRAVLPEPTGLWLSVSTLSHLERAFHIEQGISLGSSYPPMPIVKDRSSQSLPSIIGISRPV
jgi:hypothetical protein